MALQDLLGHAWPHLGSDSRASDEDRRRERSLWCHACEPDPTDRRSPPSGRMGASHMPRGVFLGLALGWGAIVIGLLGIVIALRCLG